MNLAAIRDLAGSLLHPPSGLGESYAVLVEVDGDVVFEGYAGSLPNGQAVTRATPLLSWSMAKSVTQLLAGLAHDDGLINIDAPAPVSEWANDARAEITVRNLLHMTSGLAWTEEYTQGKPSDVIEMLFGSGLADCGAFAASKELVENPGTSWLYSSGTTNIVCRILRDAFRTAGTDTLAFLNSRLLIPAGIDPAATEQLRFDQVGTWIGSSFLYLPAASWLGLGRLMLHQGRVDGREVIGRQWVDDARTPGPIDTGEPYGYSNHWWLWPKASATPDAFAAFGYEGQHVVVIPSKRAVVVRLGTTPDEQKVWVRGLIHRVIESL